MSWVTLYKLTVIRWSVRTAGCSVRYMYWVYGWDQYRRHTGPHPGAQPPVHHVPYHRYRSAGRRVWSNTGDSPISPEHIMCSFCIPCHIGFLKSLQIRFLSFKVLVEVYVWSVNNGYVFYLFPCNFILFSNFRPHLAWEILMK